VCSSDLIRGVARGGHTARRVFARSNLVGLCYRGVTLRKVEIMRTLIPAAIALALVSIGCGGAQTTADETASLEEETEPVVTDETYVDETSGAEEEEPPPATGRAEAGQVRADGVEHRARAEEEHAAVPEERACREELLGALAVGLLHEAARAVRLGAERLAHLDVAVARLGAARPDADGDDVAV